MKNTVISREIDYAVRICVLLALVYRKRLVTLGEISRVLAVGKPSVTKVVFRLRKQNILRSVMGKYGGIYLVCDPKKLSIYDIMKAMNFNGGLNECTRNAAGCPLTGNCQIREFFLDLEDGLLNAMRKKTVVELAEGFRELAENLGHQSDGLEWKGGV